MINSNTNVQADNPIHEALLNELMELELNEASIGQYTTHAQIIQEERAQLGTEEEYIERMRSEAQNNGEEYTTEYEDEDRDIYYTRLTSALNRAHTYRNDLHNYARALLRNWSRSGEQGPLM